MSIPSLDVVMKTSIACLCIGMIIVAVGNMTGSDGMIYYGALAAIAGSAQVIIILATTYVIRTKWVWRR